MGMLRICASFNGVQILKQHSKPAIVYHLRDLGKSILTLWVLLEVYILILRSKYNFNRSKE